MTVTESLAIIECHCHAIQVKIEFPSQKARKEYSQPISMYTKQFLDIYIDVGH